jgi:hypothetical protein
MLGPMHINVTVSDMRMLIYIFNNYHMRVRELNLCYANVIHDQLNCA